RDAGPDAVASLVAAAGEDAADEVRREVRMVGAAARLRNERPLGREVGSAGEHGAVVAGRARLDGGGAPGDLGEPVLVRAGQHAGIVRRRRGRGQGCQRAPPSIRSRRLRHLEVTMSKLGVRSLILLALVSVAPAAQAQMPNPYGGPLAVE